MRTLLLSQSDLHEIISRVGVDRFMDELIARLEAALRGFDPAQTEIPIRAGFHYEAPVTGLIEWMPLLEKQRNVLMKVVGYHPDSPDRLQMPTILSTLHTYDPSSGHLVALVDGTFLTAMRTGAASAVASRVLAKPSSSTLGLIGCGAQAVTQLHALSRVFPLRDVLIYDVDPAAVASFSSRITAFSDRTLRICAAPINQLVAQVDILCVATSVGIGQGPVFSAQVMRPELHVNAVGSDFPGKIECPKEFLTGAFVCADVIEQAIREGECQQLTTDQIDSDLVSIVQNPDSFHDRQSELSVFDSTGWALEDQVALTLLLSFAKTFGVGAEIQIESVNIDPKDPYEFLSPITPTKVVKARC